MKKTARRAIEVVADHDNATWFPGEDARHVRFVLADRKLTVGIATLKLHACDALGGSKPRLRFDRVATRVVSRLRDALAGAVPNGKTLYISITAPILVPSKTAADVERLVQTRLARRPVSPRMTSTVNGNVINVRLVSSRASGARAVIGFVHNRETDADALFDRTSALLACTRAVGRSRSEPTSADDQWLVLASDDGPELTDTYREICAQLALANVYERVVIVFAGGEIASLLPSPSERGAVSAIRRAIK